jgi:signal transduction histidine kinase
MISKFKKYGIVICIFIIAVISSIISFVIVDRQLKNNLIIRAETVSTLLETQPIADLQGNSLDLESQPYVSIKQSLMSLHAINTDSRFVYVMKYTKEGVIFLVDSEPTDSSDYSPPGQLYDEASPELLDAIQNGKSGLEIAGDRWGTWVTGYAPIRDPNTHEVIALLGIDLDYYSNYVIPIFLYTSIPFLAFLIILLITLYSRRLYEVRKNAIDEKEALMKVAKHELGTPMAEIRWMIDYLLTHKAIVKDENALSVVRQLYISSNTILRRITNLLKASELTDRDYGLREVFNITDILSDTLENQKKIAENMGITLTSSKDIPRQTNTEGNIKDIKIAFSNILAHSLFYAKEKKVFIDYRQESSFHTFTFLSYGDTLSGEEASILFAPYYHGKPMSSHTEGTGFGLFVTQKIVKLHNGLVYAKTTPKGVEITISLCAQ